MSVKKLTPKFNSICWQDYLDELFHDYLFTGDLKVKTGPPKPKCTDCIHRFKYQLTQKCEAIYESQTK
jgi:hypothetical protein